MMLFLANLNDNFEKENVWNKILSLVGKFDLDPDRVLDLVVESQLLHPSQTIYAQIIKKFKGESVSLILANKLSKIP